MAHDWTRATPERGRGFLVVVFGEFSDRDGKKIKNWV